jgi:hypothetical protein
MKEETTVVQESQIPIKRPDTDEPGKNFPAVISRELLRTHTHDG